MTLNLDARSDLTGNAPGIQSEQRFREEIVTALKGCDVDPYEECDVDAAARFLAKDQHTNAPDEFWTVVKRHRRRKQP